MHKLVAKGDTLAQRITKLARLATALVEMAEQVAVLRHKGCGSGCGSGCLTAALVPKAQWVWLRL